MTVECIHCGDSSKIKKCGKRKNASGQVKQRYKCFSCNRKFTENLKNNQQNESSTNLQSVSYIRTDEWLKQHILNKTTLVVTSAQNNTEVDRNFLSCLKSYCAANSAALIVIPLKYRKQTNDIDVSDDNIWYDSLIEDYLIENTIFCKSHNLKIYASLKISPTAENPLSGIDPLSKGNSIIIGHPQFQLRTLPNSDCKLADIISTTGSLTVKNYSHSKLGEKARFNHSMGAVVIQLDTTSFHLTNLNYDEKSKSFSDIDLTYYSNGSIKQTYVNAIVTGDEHAIFADPTVTRYTYTNLDSLVNLTRPKFIVRHDVLDSYSISHHHRHNQFTQFAKFNSGKNNIKDELDKTIDYIVKTTPADTINFIVQSNHNEHLLKWLNEVNIKEEPWNQLIYHELMVLMLRNTTMTASGASYPDPFMLYCHQMYNKELNTDNIVFSNRSGFKIKDIEIGQHGDRGISGARGSSKSFSKFPVKTIVGHSHSPAVEKSCYVVGTSSMLKLEYNTGASSWHHAHVLIHENGKRQIVFITKDGFRKIKK